MIGLALAGGGPVGAVYEIGALRALDEALDGVEFHDLELYVGVSAGSFVAACLANGITSRQLCRATFARRELPFVAEAFFAPAFREWIRRLAMTPGLAYDACRDYVANARDESLLDSWTRLARALPVGIFDNEPIRAYLAALFAEAGRTDDFRRLGRKLFVVAADLDTAREVRFGEPGTDLVPISRAVQASAALPGLYPPVEIDGRHYVDGVLLKTLHASVALDNGADLLICLNPIVPVDTGRGRLIHRGLPAVLSQTFRTLVHSRLEVGMASYETRYPHADVVLLEPRRDDYRMFFTNIFKLSGRRSVCEHAYQATRRQLRERRAELEPILDRHGIRLRTDVLDEPRTLEPDFPSAPRSPVTAKLDRALDRLETLLRHA